MKKTSAFTRSELLVALASISVLFMLLTILGGARSRSQAIVCQSNLAIMGRGCAMYQQENDGWILPGLNQPPGWLSLLCDSFQLNAGGQPVGEVPDWAMCPALPESLQSFAGGYAYNFQVGGLYYPMYQISQIDRPSEKIIITEGTRIWPYTTVFEFNEEHIDWFRHATNKPADADRHSFGWLFNTNAFETYGPGAFNLLWLDGHVTSETHETAPMLPTDPYQYYWLFP